MRDCPAPILRADGVLRRYTAKPDAQIDGLSVRLLSSPSSTVVRRVVTVIDKPGTAVARSQREVRRSHFCPRQLLSAQARAALFSPERHQCVA